MAEAVLFSVASKLLSTISSPAFEFAYQKGLSIWEAMDELDKLKTTIQTVQAVLIDAERKQEGSVAVKNWIQRVSDVLYEADNLFDEVVIDGMLKQQTKAYKPFQKVQLSSLKLINSIVYRNSIAKKVKAIRKSLSDISSDMNEFKFVSYREEEVIHSSRSRGKGEKGSYVDSKKVIGRDEEMKSIFVLLKESEKRDEPVVISIVGIGGMGKTTLAQLIYNDDQVKDIFPHRWFACISDASDEKEVIGKIFQSICRESYVNCTISQLQTEIMGSIEGKKFLLVLDDVWDDDRSKWVDRLSLLSRSAKGSKIIVTTRSSSVGLAVGASKTHHLGGLSYDDSWELFQSVAFPPGIEKDRKLIDVGREIVKKCANVPLAITSIGGLLCTKNTLREWESFRDGQFSNQIGDPVMKALRLSYDPLPSNLKHCFAYCSLFPKDYEYDVQMLIYLWNSQGYIKLDNEVQTVEEVGHLYFMELLRRGFFQEVVEDQYGEIVRCKMHDLLHDLAQTVAGKEIEMVTVRTRNQSKHSARHVGVVSEGSWEIVAPLLDIKRVRSVAFTIAYRGSQLALDQQRFTDLKCLRALSLPKVGMNNVSSCIGELKHLRYLDLSCNRFESLPDSITKLLNLVTLNLELNNSLIELPHGFRELISLRYVNIDECWSLKHMPPGMGELTSLEYLSDFKVGKAIKGVEASGVDALATLLEQLKGKLDISFDYRISLKDWNENANCWKLPLSLTKLTIWNYPGVRIPHWKRADHLPLLPNLIRSLSLYDCKEVKYLPPLRCLPNLTHLCLRRTSKLEYVEEEEEGSIDNATFFPCLEQLELLENPKLKGWWREVEATTSAHPMFPSLSTVEIERSPNLESIPLCSSGLLLKLYISFMDGDCSDGVLKQLLSNTGGSNSPYPSSFQEIRIHLCHGITSFSDLQFTSLRKLEFWRCDELLSVQLEARVASLKISKCRQLKILHIAHPNVLEELVIYECPEFDKESLDWDSFPNLRKLEIDWNPDAHEKLPDCLRHLHDIGQLHIQFRTMKPMKD